MSLRIHKQQDEFGALAEKLTRLRSQLPSAGHEWAVESATAFYQDTHQNLATQGRGGIGPPLSSITLHIYEMAGEPDGSGIANHITLKMTRNGAVVGIPNGKPGIIAKVQDRGAIIEVTDKMRGFLSAQYGIHLRRETTHIRIPARRFWQEAIRQARRQAPKRLKQTFRRIIQ